MNSYPNPSEKDVHILELSCQMMFAPIVFYFNLEWGK